jgi:hypothetical protein
MMAAALVLSGLGLAGAQEAGQEPKPESKSEPQPGPGTADPKAIWPAGLDKLAGRYVFVQVASPGGLWERSFTVKKGEPATRQVSMNEIPRALRDRLTRAEIIISDLTLPTMVEASERLSPSGRGMLRYYSETTTGKLVMRNVPGIGGVDGETGDYTGTVVFKLDHQGHSNPSVSGVLVHRMRQEPTWGAATLDYADLQATALPKVEAKDGKPAEPDEEGQTVIANARILRSGVEIFAFVDWTDKDRKGKPRAAYTGSIRLLRQMEGQPRE